MARTKITQKSRTLQPKHFFVSGVVVFFLTGVLLGGFFLFELNNRNQFTNKLHVFSPGQVISNNFYDVRIDAVDINGGAAGSIKPAAGSQYLIVDLYVKNKSGKTLPLFPYSQTYIKDNTGKTYSIGPAMVDQPFQGGDLISGDIMKGQIAYLVPRDIKNPKFYFEGLASMPVVVKL